MAGAGGTPACEPTPGSETHEYGCDQVRVAVIERPGEPAKLQVRARISSFASGEVCVVLDQVVLGDDQNALQTIDLAGGVPAGDDYHQTLFEVDAASAISGLCPDESKRIEPFGFIARGRVDGGSFTAKCGTAGFGTGWPPHVVLTCHSGIWEQPNGGSSMVQPLGPYISTDLYATFGHPADGSWKLTGASGDIRILPAAAPFSSTPPLFPFDTTGWTPSASETTTPGTVSLLQFFSNEEELGTDVCPLIDPNQPFPEPSPVFIAKVSGQTSEGPFKSEIFVDFCTRVPKAP